MTQSDKPHLLLAGLRQQADYVQAFAEAGRMSEALEHAAAVEGLLAAYRKAVGAVLPAPDQQAAEIEQLRERLEEAEDTAELHARNTQAVARERESYRKAWKEEQARRAKAEAELRRLAGEAPQDEAVPRCTCGETACESDLCDCDSAPCPVDHTREAPQDEAREAIARVRSVVHIADDEDVTDWQRGFRACSVVVLDALDGVAREARQDPAPAIPQRGDQFDVWLQAQRDECAPEGCTPWRILDQALTAYRLHADTGTPLTEHVCPDAVARPGRPETDTEAGRG